MRWGLTQVATATLVVGFSAWSVSPRERPLTPPFVYNASASLPVGLYRQIKKDELERGDIVRIALPASVKPVIARWGYAQHPSAQFLIKQVVALPGQTVCHQHGAVVIDDCQWGIVHRQDHLGQPLPAAVPDGTCQRLGPTEYFIATSDAASLDSRYFGPVKREDILQVLKPLWVAVTP